MYRYIPMCMYVWVSVRMCVSMGVGVGVCHLLLLVFWPTTRFLCDQSQKWKNQLMLHFE